VKFKFKRKMAYRSRHAPGTAPGTLSVSKDAKPSTISIMGYGPDDVEEVDDISVSDIAAYQKKWPLVWVNINGLGSLDILEEIGAHFDIHRLALEDVLNVRHRPKIESFKDTAFLIMRMARMDGRELDVEQVSLFVGKNFVLTIQERAGDCFDPVRDRIRKGAGRRIREAKPDYLGYALMDAVIDGFFPLLEQYDQALDEMEEVIFSSPSEDMLSHAHDLKKEIRLIRQAAWPLREVVNGYADEVDLVSDDMAPFIRDCYDHIVQIIDLLESHRERSASLIDMYLSSLSHRMNEVMKVLTIIATIFIPLGFIAGLYGMNFNPEISRWNMPETQWMYGYPFAIGLMVACFVGFLLYFKRKDWL